MKFLVTGVHGQVGSALVRLLKECGLEVVFVSREQWNIAVSPKFGEQIVLSCKPDIVVNSAAFTDVDGAEDNKEIALNVNALGPRSLARACCKLNIPIIQISTDYVFDGRKGAPYEEDDITCPINTYGRTKLLGEIAVQEETQRHIILRTSWIFSESGKNFVNSILQKIRHGDELRVVNDQFGGPTSAQSIASAILAMSERLSDNYGVYHYSGQPFASWFELAVAIQEFVGAYDPLKYDKAIIGCSSSEFSGRARRPSNSTLASDKTQRVFGLDPCDWKAELKNFFTAL